MTDDPKPRSEGGLSDRWHEVDAIFQEALDRPEAERTAFLAERCGEDPGLEAMVLRLLALAEQANDGFLASPQTLGPFGRQPGASGTSPGDLFAPGDQVGDFELAEKLGSGGAGVVFRARRVEPAFGQEVAIKLLFGTMSPGSEDLFEQERNFLARLRHPNIVGLITGGVTGEGYRFLVMELVEGVPVTEYCREQGLAVRQRVRLLLRICDAVAFAHGRMVVHGDLKPSNLLVTPDGHPKLLDFGIAQVLHAEGAGPLEGLEGSGRRSLSPLYASPEQIEGERLTVTSDVFQLGTLLHEMLSGRNPWAADSSNPSDVLRRIRQGSPTRPSELAAVRPPGEDGAREPSPVPAGQLRGDLDSIVGRCLEADPERRYANVAELAAELRRYLDHYPVEARKAAAGYRVGKFARRRPIAASLLGAMGVVGALAVTGSVLHAARVSAERDRTQQEADRAEATVDFLLSLLAEAGETGAVDSLSAGRLLALGEARVEEEMQHYPDLRLAILGTLADAYDRTGRDMDARALDLRRVDLARATWGASDPRTAEVLRVAGLRRIQARHWPAGIELLEAWLVIERARPGRAVRSAEDAARMRNILLGLAPAYRETGAPDRAVAVVREAMALRGSSGDDDERVAAARELGMLAFALRGEEKFDEAEDLYLEALELVRSGDEAGEGLLALLLNNYASLLRGTERELEAEPLIREMMERLAALGESHQNLREIGYINFISLLGGLGRHDEAVATAMEMNAWLRSLYPPDHWRIGRSTMEVGGAHWVGDNCAEAEPWLTEGVGIYREGLGPDHGWTASARVMLGACLLALERNGEAAVMLAGTLEPLVHETTPRPLVIDRALEQAEILRLREGRSEEVESVRALRQALADEGVPGIRALMAQRAAANQPAPR